MQQLKHQTLTPQKRICDAVNPPPPTSSSTTTAIFDAISGQRLLSLLKTYDKYKQSKQHQNLDVADGNNSRRNEDHDNDTKTGVVVEEIIGILQQLTIIVQRQGLLRRNSSNISSTATAKQVLDSMSMNKQQQHATSTGKKKRKGNHQTSQQLQLDETMGVGTIDDTTTTNTATTTTADVQLLMMSIIRIIENYHDHDVDRLIYTTTTDLITASCQYNIIQQQSMNANNPIDLCFLAEYELIASSCKSLLSGIEQYIRRQHAASKSATMKGNNEIESRPQPHEVNDYSTVSSFRAVTSMIGLLGNKLFTTRNNSSTNTVTAVLSKLQELAWQTVWNVPHPQQPQMQSALSSGSVSILQTQKAAIILLTTIPYAAATAVAATTASTNFDTGSNAHNNRMNISMSWNQTWVDAISALSYTIQQLPIEKGSSDNKKESADEACTSNMSDFVKQIVVQQWIPSIQNTNNIDEDTRVNHLLQNIQSLVTILMSLLTRESMPSISVGSLNGEINIGNLLTIIETMVSLPSLAESKYYSTKKRLRNESMSTGSGSSFSFSPLCIVTKIALPIRLIGYELFHNAITSLGSMNLLPFVRRIMKIIYQTLLSSSSNTVRHATDPTTMMFGWNNNNNNSKRGERWLHTSIIARTASIQSFQCCIQTFGIESQQLANTNNSSGHKSNSHVESSIRIICATMIEELSLKSSGDSESEWGTWNDRLKLVCTIATSLTACLNCGGSFLTPAIRDLIDMVAATSLSSIVHVHPITAFGEIKCSILQLGMAVLCTPWQDGAASTIATELMSAAQSCVQDSNDTVVSTAVASLNVCSSLHCSRLPPLHIITRPNNFLSDNTSASTAVSAENIEDKLRSTRDEMNRAKAISEDKAKANASKKSKSDPTTNQMHLKKDSTGTATKNYIAVVQSIPKIEDTKVSRIDNSQPVEKTVSQPMPQPDDEISDDPVVAKQSEPSSIISVPNVTTDVDEDFPMIIDCGPDEDDE